MTFMLTFGITLMLFIHCVPASFGQDVENDSDIEVIDLHDCVAYHNQNRHNRQQLVENSDLVYEAVERSKVQARQDSMSHAGKNPKYGENLYSEMGYPEDTLCEQAVQSWMEEKAIYNPRNPYPAGHYTQVVWKSTREVGCGAAKSTSSGWVYVSCEYYPPGNWQGQYEKNV